MCEQICHIIIYKSNELSFPQKSISFYIQELWSFERERMLSILQKRTIF